MTSHLDQALASARLRQRPYTAQEMEAAQVRVAARVADRMLHGSLAFDDQMVPVRSEAERRGTATVASRPSTAPAATAPEPQEQWRTHTASDLLTLCKTVVSRDGAPHKLQSFLAHRLLEPDGARVLGCILHIAGRDSAQFWWQFAAGAGDTTATYCLYLHHLSMGETAEAHFWSHQATTCDSTCDPLHECDATLRFLSALRRDQPANRTALVSALLDYVPDAVSFEGELDLPLPDTDFAAHIERLEEALPA